MAMQRADLERIWRSVPPDYYQRGVERNILQRVWHRRKLYTILDLVTHAPRRILDVGCASGWFLDAIHKRYPQARCTGMDVHEEAIRYGERRYPHLTLLHADAHALPFPDASFDLILCTEVLEHVLEPLRVLREIRRVLAPGGVAIIEKDTDNLLFRAVWRLWCARRGRVWEDAHLHALGMNTIERLLKQSGFAVQERRTFNATMAVAYALKARQPTGGAAQARASAAQEPALPAGIRSPPDPVRPCTRA